MLAMARFKTRPVFFLIVVSILLLCSSCVGSSSQTAKNRARALEDLGISYLREGNPNLAVKSLMEAAEADPDDPEIAYSLALSYRELGVFDRSIAAFKRALALKPDFPQAVNNMGVTYLLMGRWDEAISCFNKAAGTISYATPHYAYLNLGLAYYQKEDYQKAISYYKEALRIDSSFVMAYENLGLAYEALGEWDKARDAYQSSISHEPDSPNAYLLLGKLHRKLGRRGEAVEMLQKALDADPEGRAGKEALEILNEIGAKS
jgi:type IV pilus assembly protein PilF